MASASSSAGFRSINIDKAASRYSRGSELSSLRPGNATGPWEHLLGRLKPRESVITLFYQDAE